MHGVGAWSSAALTLDSIKEGTGQLWWHCHSSTHLTSCWGRSDHLLLVLVMSWESGAAQQALLTSH